MPLRVLQVLAALLLVIHAVLVLGMEPQFDEAYYWMWGQYLDLSYFDHPPLNAWALRLSSMLFGWSTFALRFPSWIALGVSIWLFVLWSKRLAGDDWQRWFWTILVVYLGAPVIGYFSTLMYPDYLLYALCLAAAYSAAVFIEGWEAGAPRYRYLFATAVCLGLAGLTKYNAIFLALAIPVYLLSSERRRALFADWRLYAAGLLTLLIASPILIWNFGHDFISFRFHMFERQVGGVHGAKYYLVVALLLLSPLLFGPFMRMLFSASRGGAFESATHGLARIAFVGSTVAFTSLSVVADVLPYWNVVGYLAAFPLMARFVRTWWHLLLHLLYGGAILVALAINFVVVPINVLTGGTNPTNNRNFGWTEVAEAASDAAATHDAGLIASATIAGASQLGFAMQRADVMPLGPALNQYRFWFRPAEHLGQTAIVLVDDRNAMTDFIRARFESVRQLRTVEVHRFGHLVDRYEIWLGTGFRG